ncbi:Na+/H+ antiporter subunit B [Brucella thiophenivorans]|uniref:Na+/H+ antiporter family protein n=1 Tax=Brucella thiophenivorans TaxID=571255 RepID=A0A256FPC8_9HYPH|nr:Na+/H+ antiporter subunit B [Brucella thiophenivorans]OYR16271.1 Na+/H+ antiporter family protein [Brucella thiophenivorans]
MNSLILRTGARLLTALFLLFSLYVLLRGHNAPGGGFIGGLIGAAGFTLYAFATGTAQARSALKVDPQSVGAIGMGVALIAGLFPAMSGGSPFTGLWLTIGNIPISTVLLFDIGVYLAVFGAILTLVFGLEEMRS